MTRTHFNRWLIIGLAILILSIVVVAWANQTNSDKSPPAQRMAADFTVSGMTCGGCIYTIQQSLKSIKGIQSIDVDIRGKRVSTVYDAGQLSDPQLIAKAITESGYPATFTRQAPLKPATISDSKAKESNRPIAGSYGGGGGCACCGGSKYKVQ